MVTETWFKEGKEEGKLGIFHKSQKVVDTFEKTVVLY
jgi:hypothetical protein